MEKKFNLGQVVMTQGIARISNDFRFQDFVVESLMKHANGDWGDLCEEDKSMNDYALEHDAGRLFSSYIIPKWTGFEDEGNIYIITEYDRSYTTILFPSEY